MDISKAFEKIARKIKPIRIQMEIAEGIMDDTPVSYDWVKDIVDHTTRYSIIYKKLDIFDAMMATMLWRASCNGFNDIIKDISNKYSNSEIVQGIAGHSYWCAAINDNLTGMKILMDNLGSHIEAKDISEALSRAAYQDNMGIVTYILDEFDDILSKDNIVSGLSASVCFARNNVLEEIFKRKINILSLSDMTKIQDRYNVQENLYRERAESKGMDFAKTQEILNHYKNQILNKDSKLKKLPIRKR